MILTFLIAFVLLSTLLRQFSEQQPYDYQEHRGFHGGDGRAERCPYMAFEHAGAVAR